MICDNDGCTRNIGMSDAEAREDDRRAATSLRRLAGLIGCRSLLDEAGVAEMRTLASAALRYFVASGLI